MHRHEARFKLAGMSRTNAARRGSLPGSLPGSVPGLLLGLLCALGAHAGTVPLPLWELGVVAGSGWVPDYPGSGHSRGRAVLLPMLVYRGPVWKVDDEGVRGHLLDAGPWSFEISATAAFNARGSPARQDMPDLDYMLGVGPQWIYRGWQSDGRGPALHLKWRAHVSSDGREVHGHGLSFQPELRWTRAVLADPAASWTVSLQSTWATRPLGRRWYEVRPDQATPERPAYAARAGYHGTEASMGFSRRAAPGLSWFAVMQLGLLHGAAAGDSPLLRRRAELAAGLGVIWTPWRSDRPAP